MNFYGSGNHLRIREPIVRPTAAAVLMLFVAPCAFAQATKPGWGADSKTGCRIWNRFPQPHETVNWGGGCKGHLAEGQGVIQWFTDGKLGSNGFVEYHAGKLNGHGVYTRANGDRYDGEWRDGKKNGYGVFTGANGDRYDGEWRDGNQNGHGVYTWANGESYDGEWRDGKANGTGIYTKPDGTTYNGNWTNGCFKDNNRRAAVGVDLSSCP